MITYDKGYQVYIKVNDKTYVLHNNLEGLFENDELLNALTIEDLVTLFRTHFGIPSNFMEYIKKKVDLFDSLSLNSFIYQGKSYWLDKESRESIKNLINTSYKDAEVFNLILGDNIVEVSPKVFLKFLDDLNKYSYECLITLTKHKAELQNIKSLQDVLKFDYTTGYPNKLILE